MASTGFWQEIFSYF